MNAAIDYAVLTFLNVSTVQAYEPRLARLAGGGRPQARFGYKGSVAGKWFWGFNDAAQRYMLVVTGAEAARVLEVVPDAIDLYMSVARLDVQTTLAVDDAFEEVSSLAPAARYSARRLTSLTDRGNTLYVGSHSSLLMCRVYNKTAEANVHDESGRELMRVEFVLRDKYADAAWLRARANEIDAVWTSLVQRMFTTSSAERLLLLAQTDAIADFALKHEIDDDVVERRVRWLSTIVVPSLNKLIAQHPDASDRVWRELRMVARNDY